MVTNRKTFGFLFLVLAAGALLSRAFAAKAFAAELFAAEGEHATLIREESLFDFGRSECAEDGAGWSRLRAHDPGAQPG